MPFFVVAQVASFAPFVLFPFAAAGMAACPVVHKAFLVVHRVAPTVHRAFLVERRVAAVACLEDKAAAFLERCS